MTIRVKTWSEAGTAVEEFVTQNGEEETLGELPGCVFFGEVDPTQALLLLMHPDASGEFLELMDSVRRAAGQLILFLDVNGVNDLLRRIDAAGVPANLKGIIITEEDSPALIHGGSYEELAHTLEQFFKAERYIVGGTELNLHDQKEQCPDDLLGCMKNLLELSRYLPGRVHINPALLETTNWYSDGTLLSQLPEDLAKEFKRRIAILCPDLLWI